MRLCDLPEWLGMEIVRDAEFGNLGFLPDSQAAKLSFLENGRFLGTARKCEGLVCLVTTADLAHELPELPGLAICASPRLVFFELHNYLAGQTRFYGEEIGRAHV